MSGERVDWAERAACRSHEDPDLWFEAEDALDEGRQVDPLRVLEAKLLCERCPISAECLARSNGFVGIWAGREPELRGVAPFRVPASRSRRGAPAR